MNDLIKAIILGVVEGITEFLPVSSTGHLFLVSDWLGLPIDESPQGKFWKAFGIVIQIGAIFAVLIYFRKRIRDLLVGGKRPPYFAHVMPRHEVDQTAWALTGAAFGKKVAGPGAEPMTPEEVVTADAYITPEQRFHAMKMIAVASLPVLIVGLGVKVISEKLEEIPVAIALALIVGGILMLLVERMKLKITADRMEDITFRQALIIGICQILAATFPGTSRSASTIISALAVGLSRGTATEFSFFLAIPAMFAACGFKLIKWLSTGAPSKDQIVIMSVGTLVSFIVAWIVIAGFMNYVRKHDFKWFAIYRIVFGLFVIAVTWGAGHKAAATPSTAPAATMEVRK